jgi:hypothetical protein
MGLITWIIVIIVFLAILGLGWDTFFSGVKKGVDRIGVGQIVDNAYKVCKECISGDNRWIVGITLKLISLQETNDILDKNRSVYQSLKIVSL